MGANAYATVVFGFEVLWKTQYEEVTRYREDNGTPYKKRVEKYVAAVIGDTVLDEKTSDKIRIDSINEIECFTTTDNHETYLGKSLASTHDILESGRKAFEFEPKEIESVTKFAKKYGVTPSYFLVPCCSY